MPPADGEITTLFPTGHAVGIKTNNGAEILIHIGMDTVKMNGEGFKTHVQQGEKVKQGQLLIEFDIDKIKKAGYPVITPFFVTNFAEYKDIITADVKTIKGGKIILHQLITLNIAEGLSITPSRRTEEHDRFRRREN